MKLFFWLVVLCLNCARPSIILEPPACPEFSPAVLADYSTLIQAEDDGKIQHLWALHNYLEQQVRVCLAIEEVRKFGE